MDRGFGASGRVKRQIFDAPNLDEGREQALLSRAQSDGPAADTHAAITELWMSHAKLVAAIAAKFHNTAIDRDDLIAAGQLGLHTAIMRFDLTRADIRLSAYAAHWIRGSILEYIRQNAGPVRMPESKAHRQLALSAPRLIEDAKKQCVREGAEPTESALYMRVGRRLGLTEAEVAKGLGLMHGAGTSLNAGYGAEGEESDIRDDSAPTDDDVIERMDHARLRAHLRVLASETLGEREREIFLRRVMADSEPVPSLEDFAASFGVTAARVHQIEGSARRKIALALEKTGYSLTACGGEKVTQLCDVRARRRATPVTARQATLYDDGILLQGVAD